MTSRWRAMVETLPKGEIRFLVHGPDSAADDMVSASVFATKLGTLARALKAADRAQNGTLPHDYKIKKLHPAPPTAILIETTLPPPQHPIPVGRSGIEGF